tara:strand:- start:48 stop:833 length:786 start_codon:yes stop_codon:yes gene_type:complete
MLIHNTLPPSYNDSINYIYNIYKNENQNGDSSIHYWINNIDNKELKYHLNRVRNAVEIKNSIKKSYPEHNVVSSKDTDEIYLSVSPSTRSGSDVALSDCHYDAPFKYIYQGNCKFLRLIIALNENSSVYTQVKDETSLLTEGDYNVIDMNQDYHCVHGEIPKNKDRVLLKLHYIAVPYNTNKNWVVFCRNLNNYWVHVARGVMRDSINPSSFTDYIKQYLVLLSRVVWIYMYFILLFLIIFFIIIYKIPKKIIKQNILVFK